MSTSSNSDAELSQRFDKLASLIEATLQVQGKSEAGSELQSKLPGKIADVVLLEAAKASIAKTSDYVKDEIDKRLGAINQIISGYENAFSREKTIVNALISGESNSPYSTLYASSDNTAAQPASGKNSSTQTNQATSSAAGAATASSAPPSAKVDIEKINKMLTDMISKVKDSSDEDKKVMSKYVSGMEAIFKEMQGSSENTSNKKQV